MKFILFVFVVMILAAHAGEKEKQSCCGPTATEEFAAFGKSMTFVSSHLSPEPFAYNVEGGVIKEIPSADKQAARIFEVKAAEATDKYLFVIHEWWGLNDYIKKEAEALQKELGVNVIALDLYDGKVASDPQTAGQYVQQVKEKRAQIIIKAAMEYVGKEAKIATLGWCFGGGWSMQSALLAGSQAVGCVIYYGMPEKDVTRLKTLNCDVLGIFGTNDQWINPNVVEEFKKNMKSAKKNLEVKMYEADHGFANPSNPKYDKEKGDNAHAVAVAFIKSKFGM